MYLNVWQDYFSYALVLVQVFWLKMNFTFFRWRLQHVQEAPDL